MNWGRTPARSSKNLDFSGPGFTSTTCGSTNKIDNTLSTDVKKARDNTPIIHGVRLKHDPKNLSKAQFAGAKLRWHCLEKTKRHIMMRERARAYYPELQPFFVHRKKNENGQEISRGRRVRSERIESALNILVPHLLMTLNLRAMVCGYYECSYNSTSRFIPYNYNYFVQKTGLTLNRVKRCMQYLKARGLVRAHRIVEQKEKGLRTTAVFIRMSSKLFKMAGTYKEFLVDREKIKKKHEKIERAEITEMQRLEGSAPIRDFSGRPKSYVSPKGEVSEHLKKLNAIVSMAGGIGCNLPYDKQEPSPHTPASYKPKAKTNPYQDIRVISLAKDLVKDTPQKEISPGVYEEMSFREAVRRVCLRLGMDPPSH